jgi:hypothetical protein
LSAKVEVEGIEVGSMAMMDLVAGDETLLREAVASGDGTALDDRSRVSAHLSFGGGLDPTWLDQFSEACRALTGSFEPRNFLDARSELEDPIEGSNRAVERVDPSWIDSVAQLRDRDIDRLAGQWIDLLADELVSMGSEDKMGIRVLTSEIVAFARAARGAPAILFAWAL